MKKKAKRFFSITTGIIAISATALSICAALKTKDSQYENEPEEKNMFEGKKVQFISDENDCENADGVRGHLEAIGDAETNSGFYEQYGKRAIDIVLSLGGLIMLSPVFIGTAIAIKIDDPGPVLFTQKRVGKNKQFFKLHKFRSMKMSTPHDIPTHMLDNPDQYITRVGKFLRAHSLDELPQIWDIFIGNMSVIGPRPALWNQDVLIAEREKYGVNYIKPGLTGWAQINGRDELELVEKARLDGEYVSRESLLFDTKCFLETIKKIRHDDSVVEGGTGRLQKTLRQSVSIDDPDPIFGCDLEFCVDSSVSKKVLITGEGSYIGESVKQYARVHYPNLTIESIDMIDGTWRGMHFSNYDCVFHVAGIAHADVGDVSESVKEEYYKVNTDLAIEVANKAKKEGVNQFIFMSSMIVYGDSAPLGKKKMITRYTSPCPESFYGDSKWQADKGVRGLQNEVFNVAVLRPPMIYGKDSKGNYPKLSKLAKLAPFFPAVNNQRSMLFIDNLCDFLCQLIMTGMGGIYMPQNEAYTTTSEMVEEIGIVTGKPVKLVKLLNPSVWFAACIPGKISNIVSKAFGNNCYDMQLSTYKGLDYQKVDFRRSIMLTEDDCYKKKKVLFLVNHDVVIYNFRLEIVERLIADGYEVHISSPYGDRIDDLIRIGAVHHDILMERHGINPIKELNLLIKYDMLIKEINPDIILGFTIKPNIYGAIAARKNNKPFIANITGLGTAVEYPGFKQKISILMYKYAFRGIHKVFFQNEENRDFFTKHGINVKAYDILPGSGVNLKRFSYCEYPNDDIIRFAFISRVMKEKGIEQYLDAAREIRKKYENVEFHVCGFCEPEYNGRLQEEQNNGIVIYHGMIRNVDEFIAKMNCVVHPSYYPEGLSNVLLEASATGRPIITTDRAGCREVVEDGVTGFMIPCKNTTELIIAIDKFINLNWEEKRDMGKAARKKVETEFDRQIVVERYLNEIDKIERGK